MIRVRCHHCGKIIKVSEQHAGKRARCPNTECHQEFRVPSLKSLMESHSSFMAAENESAKSEKPADSSLNRKGVKRVAQRSKATSSQKSRPGAESATPPPLPMPAMPHRRAQKKRSKQRQQQMVILRWSMCAVLVASGVFASLFLLQSTSDPSTQQLAAAEVKPNVSYEADIQPLLQKYCADCHSQDYAEAEVSFDQYHHAADINADRDIWIKTLKRIKVGAMPPSSADQPTEEERQLLTEYLDHELYYVNCDLPADPGRVTVRRLNRTEYDNTIRDLLGVDFQPADSFPSDDVGYGFDNIGDVLSVQPLLIEKYLDAAEQVAARALQSQRAEYRKRHILGKSLKEEGSAHPGPRDSMAIPSRGKAFEKFTFADGEYRLRVKAVADQAGDELAKMRLRIGNEFDQTVEIKEHKKPAEFTFTVRLAAGEREVSAEFLNDYYNEDAKDRRDRNLYIGFIEVEGPIDPPVLSAQAKALLNVTPQDGVTALHAAQANLREFIPRAFRRPTNEAEVLKYAEFVELAAARGEDFTGAMRIALQAILVSPQFLFRSENSLRREGDYEMVDDFALASRLSYFLWSSCPDETLLRLAGQKKLHEPAVLEEQTLRMLQDPKAQALVENFSGQWLGLRRLTTNEVAPDPQLFPQFNEELRKDMWRETELFFGSVVRSNRSIYELLQGNYTFVNERLAKFYGLDGIKGDEFRRVDLSNNVRGGGVLTHGSVLTLTSYPNRTSPVKRGQWVLENLLGDAPPDPPPNAPALEETGAANPNLSFREQLQIHREDPGCASCHVVMDEIGFGLENFNPIGQWREQDGKHPVDASGALPTGETFRGPRELVQILMQRKEDFGRCLSEKLLIYATGRGLEYYDKCAVDRIMERLENDDRMNSLVLAIVESAPFQSRRIRQ